MISKSVVKKIVIISAIVAVLGGSLTFIGFCAAGFQTSALYSVTKEQREYIIESNDINGIVMDMELSGIELAVDENAKNIKLEYTALLDKNGKELNAFEFKSENGICSLEEKSNWNWLTPGWDLLDINAKLILPDLSDLKLTLSTINSDITIHSGLAVKELKATSINGEIEISGVDAMGLVGIESTNGEINVKEVRGSEIDVKSTNGEVEANNISANKVNITTTNGEISTDGGIIDGESVKLTSTNGSINVKLKGASSDYSKTVTTINGSSNISAETGGSKLLEVATTNGSINVNFEQ